MQHLYLGQRCSRCAPAPAVEGEEEDILRCSEEGRAAATVHKEEIGLPKHIVRRRRGSRLRRGGVRCGVKERRKEGKKGGGVGPAA